MQSIESLTRTIQGDIIPRYALTQSPSWVPQHVWIPADANESIQKMNRGEAVTVAVIATFSEIICRTAIAVVGGMTTSLLHFELKLDGRKVVDRLIADEVLTFSTRVVRGDTA